MSSRSQNVGGAVILKFDMHVYTSILTFDEVKSLVAEYAIPLDLHPCVPPSGQTMNRLPVDKIGVRISKGFALAADEVIHQHTTKPLPFGAQILEKFDHQKVVKYENERVLAAKRKAQAAKDKAIRKRSGAEGTSRRNKKKKTDPLTFALDETEGDDSIRSGSETHHSTLPLNTIILDGSVGGNGNLESVHHSEDDVKHRLDDEGDGTQVNSPYDAHSFEPQPSNHSDEDTHVHSDRGGLHHDERVVTLFPNRNAGGDGAGSSLWTDVVLPAPFASTWNLTTHYISNDVESCRDMMINLATLSVREHQSRLRYYQALQHLCFKLNQGALAQIDLLQRIKRLEEELASKTSSLTEAEGSVSTLKGDLERLTIDLSHAEIVRHNYVCQLFPTAFQRLLSSDKYKKSLSDVFNHAIIAGWSEGVKVGRSEEDAEAILADATDNDSNCKYAFMSAFESLFTKIYSYVEKLVGSFCLHLGKLQNIWPKGEGPTIEMRVTWPLALGIIWNVLRFGKYASLDHWHLDSSGSSCVLGNARHLAVGAWTHPKRVVFWDMCVTWPLALGLIRNMFVFKEICVTWPLALGFILGVENLSG
nr:hypothetical protein [Tanacetum cinerariifolium]